MPGIATQPDSDEMTSNLIPKGREADYFESRAQPVETHFLDMQIDRANMYIGPLPITNGAEDRDGEVTNPNGLIDTTYRTSPIVMFQHSHRTDPLVPPIGTAETPDRKFNLFRQGDVWLSGCRFTQETKMARQVFRLIDDGIIRARSIGALNHALSYYKPKMPGMAFHQGQIVPVKTKSVSHDKYELIEWSWVIFGSNRDIVTPLKSVMSKGYIDGRPIDSGLHMILKSLDLREPETNAKHMGRNPRFNWPLGDSTVSKSHPAAFLFDMNKFSPASVKSFLSASGDVGVIDTELRTEMRDGTMYLKSVQFQHDGDFEVSEHPQLPGAMVLFAKATPTDQISQVVAEDELKKPEEQTAGAPPVAGSAPAAPAAPAADTAPSGEASSELVPAVEDAVKALGPNGARFLQSLIKNATALADQAEAAVSEQEPEMLEKCQELTGELRGFIEKVSAFNNERYGTANKQEGKEQEPSPELSKSAKAGLFYGTVYRMPESFVKGLKALHAEAQTETQQRLTSAMLKGLAIPEVVPDPAIQEREALKERILAIQKRLAVGSIS